MGIEIKIGEILLAVLVTIGVILHIAFHRQR